MDAFQERLTRLGLEVLEAYGFALAGGFALQAHHLVERMSEDVDLFTDSWDPDRFTEAVDEVSKVYTDAGFTVTVGRRADTFARLHVSSDEPAGSATVDLAADFRRFEPVILTVGPVLSENDAVGSKVAAVFSRGEARDYIDLAGILRSGRHSVQDLVTFAQEVDGGFSRSMFAEALAAIDRFPDSVLAAYGLDQASVDEVRTSMRALSSEMRQDPSRGQSASRRGNPARTPPARRTEYPSPEPPEPGISL